MNLIAPSPVLVQQLAAQLRARQEELAAQLHAGTEAAAHDAPGEVVDFKDVAAEDARAWIDEAAQAHATQELDQIAGALRRVEAGTYGQCQDCGEVIDERRLRALAATRYCTACQAIRERPGQRR